MRNRRWLNQSQRIQVVKTTPDKERHWLSYATITSTVAILISLSSFYFSWFYVNHSLKISIVSTDSTYPYNFQTDLVAFNHGNKTETLLYLQLFYVSSDGLDRTFSEEYQKGPFVLKPGDVIPIRVDWASIGNDVFYETV